MTEPGEDGPKPDALDPLRRASPGTGGEPSEPRPAAQAEIGARAGRGEREDADLGERGSAAPAVPESPAEAEPEDEDLEGRPDSPVFPLATLREALDWAFKGEEVAPAVLDLFARHAEMLLHANRVVNLTAVVDPREMAAKHYLDSWRVTRQVSLYGRTALDLGSGAGFPGLPVAMTEPDTRVVLLDSTKKRVQFLSDCIAALGLKNVTAVWARAEDHLARNKYDVVMLRAVSSVRENVRLLRKVRHSHKDLVMLKGPSWSREVRAGEREAERLGFRLDTVWEHSLPEGMGERAILVYRAPGAQGG